MIIGVLRRLGMILCQILLHGEYCGARNCTFTPARTSFTMRSWGGDQRWTLAAMDQPSLTRLSAARDQSSSEPPQGWPRIVERKTTAFLEFACPILHKFSGAAPAPRRRPDWYTVSLAVSSSSRHLPFAFPN